MNFYIYVGQIHEFIYLSTLHSLVVAESEESVRRDGTVSPIGRIRSHRSGMWIIIGWPVGPGTKWMS